MEENIKIPSKEEVSQFLDLNVENVNKVFLYAKADLEGNILVDSEVAKQEKLGPLMKAVTLREEGTSSETPVYLNLLRLVVVRGTVIGFFQPLQVSFLDKGLKKEDPLYTKAVLKDLIGLKACDGKTNVIKLKNKAGREEYVSVWADQAHKDSIDKLLYLARALYLIDPLRDSGVKDNAGNPVLSVDTTQGIFEGMIPRYSAESKATLAELMKRKAEKAEQVKNEENQNT